MIRIVSFVGLYRIRSDDRILRISFIGSPYTFGTPHGHTMIISGPALGTHNIIISVSFGQMRCLNAATIRSTLPDPFRISDDLLFLRIILGNCDHARLLITFSCLPVQRYNVFTSVIIMKDRSVKTGGMQVYRLTPWSLDILCRDQKIVHIKITGIHRIHYTIDHIKHILCLAVGQTWCPDPFRRRKLFEIRIAVICQHMGIKLPVFHIARMIDRNSRKPLKGRYGNVVIIPFPADTRIRIKTF